MFRYIKLIGLIFIIQLLNVSAFALKPLPKDGVLITEDELRLIELINTYRYSNNLPIISTSACLTHVAHTHILDLYQNHPDTSICNLHSWSDKGDWSSGCYQNYYPNQDVMWDKPKELTPYKYRGYELAYWDEDSITPDIIFDRLLEIPQVKDMLLNKGAFEKKKWLAIGTGIQRGYALVWFGQVKDNTKGLKEISKTKEKSKVIPKREQIALIVKKKSGRFYVIFGSFQTKKEAAVKLKKYISLGFRDAKMIINRNKIRISLSDYPNLKKAKKAKAELSPKYKDAWIIKF